MGRKAAELQTEHRSLSEKGSAENKPGAEAAGGVPKDDGRSASVLRGY